MYHLHVRVIGRNKNRNSVAVRAAAYRSRGAIYDEVGHKWANYSNKKDLSADFILAPSGSPNWVFDREVLWNDVEVNEKRVDSQVCREIEISLPQSFHLDRSVKVVRDFVDKECVGLGMIADVCLHGIGSANPHAHVLLTMRRLQNDGSWSKKCTEWNARSKVQRWRKSWEKALNDEFIDMGMRQLKVSCESYKSRGITKNPQKYCGPRRIRLWREKEVIEPESAQYVIDQLKKQEDELQKEIDFRLHLQRRMRRRAAQMLNDSLSALAGARSELAIVGPTPTPTPTAGSGNGSEIKMQGMAGRLAAHESLAVDLPKPNPGVSPGHGFG
jgi:hypothetical protein